MALSPIIPAAPLVADILFIAHRAPAQVAVEFLDAHGNSLASGLTDPDALDALGRQAMAVAAAARACDPAVVPIGQRPRARAPLLPGQSTRYRFAGPREPGQPAEPSTQEAGAQPDGWADLDAQARALAYMIAAVAALALACALVAWDLLK